MRYLPDVIDKIVAEIPKDGYEDLRKQLASIKESASYAAPENSRMWWEELCLVLNGNLEWPPKLSWQCAIDDIVADRVKR